MNKIENLEIWIITFIIAIVLIVGIFYYEIIGAVANALAFIISLTIIFLALILLIIFSHKNHKRKQEISNHPLKTPNKKKQHFEKPQVKEQETPVKKISSKESIAVKKK